MVPCCTSTEEVENEFRIELMLQNTQISSLINAFVVQLSKKSNLAAVTLVQKHPKGVPYILLTSGASVLLLASVRNISVPFIGRLRQASL